MARKKLPDHLWKPGESGNPKGRPKGGQALTEILRADAEKKAVGSRLENKKLLSKRLWTIVTKGYLQIGNERIEVKSIEEWMKVVAFIYERVDGLPRQSVSLETPQAAGHPTFITVVPPPGVKDVPGKRK